MAGLDDNIQLIDDVRISSTCEVEPQLIAESCVAINKSEPEDTDIVVTEIVIMNSNNSEIKEQLKKLKEKNDTKDNEEEEPEEKVTLLQKALQYRSENAVEWEKQKKEEEQKLKESYGIFDKDLFLEDYYEKVEQLEKKEKLLEEEIKSYPPRLFLQLEFNHPRHLSTRKNSSDPVETYKSIAADGVSVFDKDDSILDFFKKQSNEERGKDPELLISASKVKYINNILPDEDYMQECRIKCRLFPDCTRRGPKLRSEYVYCDIKGKTKWNHVFVLKGFTVQELRKKYVILDVVGKQEDKKVTVGRVILAGKNAKVSQKGSLRSVPASADETYHWHEALDKPGTAITVVKDLRL